MLQVVGALAPVRLSHVVVVVVVVVVVLLLLLLVELPRLELLLPRPCSMCCGGQAKCAAVKCVLRRSCKGLEIGDGNSPRLRARQ